MKTNGGFLVTKIKQLETDFEKILSEKNIDAFNGAQGAFFMCCGRRMESQSGHSRSNAD